jgi:hypothetical protein
MSNNLITRFEVPNHNARSCRRSQISIDPELPDLLKLRLICAPLDLSALAAAVEHSRAAIRDLTSKLDTGAEWGGTISAQQASASVVDRGVFSVAMIDVPEGGSDVLAFIPNYRVPAATPAVVRRQLGFLDEAVLGNIRRETWRMRHGGEPVSAVFHVAIGEYTRPLQTVSATEYTLTVAMHRWLMKRDAAAGFARRGPRYTVPPVVEVAGAGASVDQITTPSRFSRVLSLLKRSA